MKNMLCVQEHERVMGQITPVVKPLLRPHLDDLDQKIKPGAYILNWTSMNIDGYLHHIHQVGSGTRAKAAPCHQPTATVTELHQFNHELPCLGHMRPQTLCNVW